MRVEQPVGHIDRLGQRHTVIQIALTCTTRARSKPTPTVPCTSASGLFQKAVGRLQPILVRLSALIADRVGDGRARNTDERRAVVAEVGA